MSTSPHQADACLAVLRHLSPGELERVDDREAVRRLAPGEEYIDLELPLAGAQRFREGPLPRGRILTRSTVDGRTWQLILGLVNRSDAGVETDQS